jgi:hypothetical protein
MSKVPDAKAYVELALVASPAREGRATQSTCQTPQRMRSFMRHLLDHSSDVLMGPSGAGTIYDIAVSSDLSRLSGVR